MPHDTPTLTDEQTLKTARSILDKHLAFDADGYHCCAEHLYDVLLYDVLLGACATGQSIEATCRELSETPSSETIRHHLGAALRLEDLPELEHRLNEALADLAPRHLQNKAQEVAADFHDRAYYGKAPQQQALWVRARAKDGTTRFFRIATAYLIHRGLRLTLAVHFVRPEERTVAVLESLLERVTALGISLKCLFLDKGFSGIETLAYLERARLPAIIACPIRGKKQPRPSATRALCQGRKSYRTRYTFSNSQSSFTASVAVCRVFTTARRTGRMQRRAAWLIFIVLGDGLRPLSPRQVRRSYQRRFGIETSYRLANQVRAWTSSPNPALRFMLMGLSFFMVNVWVHLCWLYTQVPRRGGRYLDRDRFRLQRFAKFIERALERTYGYPCEITASAVPIP